MPGEKEASKERQTGMREGGQEVKKKQFYGEVLIVWRRLMSEQRWSHENVLKLEGTKHVACFQPSRRHKLDPFWAGFRSINIPNTLTGHQTSDLVDRTACSSPSATCSLTVESCNVSPKKTLFNDDVEGRDSEREHQREMKGRERLCFTWQSDPSLNFIQLFSARFCRRHEVTCQSVFAHTHRLLMCVCVCRHRGALPLWHPK